MQDVYRYGAAILLLRPAENGYEFLLLRKPRKRDAWQLPQGGLEEGETVEQAAERELFEEAGIKWDRLLGKSELFYQYDFPASYRRFRPDSVKGQHISFVYALAAPHTVINVDNKEINAGLWITRDQLRRYVKRPQYLSLVESLIDEALSLL